MSHFTVLHICFERRLVGLVDGYGKCHVACITDGPLAAIDDSLHGSNPALGLHFLVKAGSGHRLSARFEFVHLSRPAMFKVFNPLRPQQRPHPAEHALQRVPA